MAAPQTKSTTPTVRKRRSPAFWLTTAFLIFLISTLIAFWQAPRPDPLKPTNLLSLDWWRYPLERNAAKRLPSITADLNEVFVLPGTNMLWAVGTRGMIVHSKDGGRTWARQPIGSGAIEQEQFQKQVPVKGAFLPLPSLFAAAYAAVQEQKPLSSPSGQPRATYDDSEKLTPPPEPEETKDPKQPDSPPPPSPPPSPPVTEPPPTSVHLYGVYFINEQEGWVVGGSGTILHTIDGGVTWAPQTSDAREDISAVQFSADGRQGWAVEPSGVLRTTDAGTTWTLQPPGTELPLYAVQFLADGRQGWAVGGRGIILSTSTGGASWAQQFFMPQVSFLTALHFLEDGSRGWVVGSEGTILHATDGGPWTQQNSGSTRELRSVHFLADGRQGWIVGDSAPIGDAPDDTGTILHTTDGGATWLRQTSGTPWNLHAVQFLDDGRQGWIVGQKGTILHTIDGGATWAPQTDYLHASSVSFQPMIYGIWPAPWYYVFGLALPLALLLFALRQHQPATPIEEESVADQLVSDRPLEAGEPDPLGFNAIARGLSRFLRNEKTQPPLTIAITGEWGTGKSSLMNLLKADLERYGFHPVWFNAWHHQQEDQLLAALLEGVRTRGVPPWWHPEGLRFRSQLLALRGRRHWLLFLLISFAIVFSAGYFVAHPQPPAEALQQVRGTIEMIASWGKDLFFGEVGSQGTSPVPAQGSPGSERPSLFPLLVSLSALLASLRRGLTTFGVDPATLLASVSGNARIRDLGAQAGFRQKFAAEFRDVTQALHPHTMLILIDDLDRCRPEKVLEVLEAINFLVSSGECYVVVGMARERVERCVGLGFRDIAEELVDTQGGSEQQNAADTGRKKRSEFARQYLEKLINIEVPVPTPTLAQSTQLLTPPHLQQLSTTDLRNKRLARALTKVLRFWPEVAFSLILVGVFWLGMISSLPSKQVEGPTSQPAVTTPASGQEQLPQGSSQTGYLPSEKDKDPSVPDSVLTLGQQGGLPLWPPLPFLLALLTAGLWMVLKSRPEVVVKDSPEFVEALKIWLPVITAKQHTPRSIKRFLNRVRYLAMCQRPQDQPHDSWPWLPDWIKQTIGLAHTNGTLARTGQTIPESILVALSAVQQRYPKWVQKNPSFTQTVNGRDLNDLELYEFSQAMAAHNSRFSNFSATDLYWNTFVEMSKGIRVS